MTSTSPPTSAQQRRVRWKTIDKALSPYSTESLLPLLEAALMAPTCSRFHDHLLLLWTRVVRGGCCSGAVAPADVLPVLVDAAVHAAPGRGVLTEGVPNDVRAGVCFDGMLLHPGDLDHPLLVLRSLQLRALGTSGPFDNDTAADFGGDLDEVAAGEREGIVRSALTCVSDTAAYLEAPESEVAVAAAALVAAQCPGGEPADPIYGPEEPLPDLTGLRDLALQALDRIMTEPSELMDLWAESDGGPWRANIHRLQNVLLPQPSGEQLSLI